MTVDPDALLLPLSDDDPCGEDLEYDAGFQLLERLAEGQPERQMGDSVLPAEPPDWRAVRTQAMELFARTRDLRVAMTLTRACFALDGMDGLHGGLQLLYGLIDRWWDEVHPRLDPDDDNDPTLRVNVLATLISEDFLAQLRETPLVRSRTLGMATLRDWQINTQGVAGTAEVAADLYEAIFQDIDVDVFMATATAAHGTLDLINALESRLTAQVGVGSAIDFDPLRQLVKSCVQLLDERLAKRGLGAGTETAAGDADAVVMVDGVASAAGVVAVAAPGRIANRDDVIRMLDRICEYYQANEPSSPVPILLQRARRLVTMDFLEIMRNLAPDGLSQIETIKGPDPDAEGDGY